MLTSYDRETSSGLTPRPERVARAGNERFVDGARIPQVTSCMLMVAASVSRSRLPRQQLSKACESSWFDSMSWRRARSSPAEILSNGGHLVIPRETIQHVAFQRLPPRLAADRDPRASATWWPPIIATESAISIVAY